jgi:hypothetical protein
MLYQLQPLQKEPEWIELIPAQGERAAVRVHALPASKAVRSKAYAASGAVLEGTDEDALKADAALAAEAGEAFGAALIRARIIGWDGIGGADGAQPVPFSSEALEAFLDDDTLFAAAYAQLAMPVILRTAEKNGLSPSPSGTGAGATPASGTASSRARPKRARAAKPAPIASTPPLRARAKKPGK